MIKIDMISIKEGTFHFGDKVSVTVSDFQIGKYPVTQKQWREIMGNNPSHFKGDDLPVESVSWDDIQEFLKKLNANNPGKIYRLPTEAEWEYAARGGNVSKGYTFAGSNNLNKVGWYLGNSNGKTHPVGRKKPNELGLYDMSGNVWEWCADWYGDYPKNAEKDYTGPGGGKTRVLRGGSWNFINDFCHSALRYWYVPNLRYYGFGFRLAM